MPIHFKAYILHVTHVSFIFKHHQYNSRTGEGNNMRCLEIIPFIVNTLRYHLMKYPL